MVRRVNFLKAALAGILGAIAWEIVARIGILAGLPLSDIVFTLGTIAFSPDRPWLWWPTGMLLHAFFGVILTIFYAYFFWTDLKGPPAVQGMTYAAGASIVAGLVMVPQLIYMHPSFAEGDLRPPGIFAWRIGWGGPVALIAGHLIYGLVMGWIYVRPVGHSVKSEKRHLPKPSNYSLAMRFPYRKTYKPYLGEQPHEQEQFIFATGIECSYPTIENGRWRMDEMELTDHYRYWRRDLELVRELGLRYLRYGPPLHLMLEGPGKYDWSFMDEVGQYMQELGIIPLMDLCHFGVPAWLGKFQNEQVCHELAEYAGAFAERFPWVKYYTPVNEMYVTAKMSALDGVWNEQLRSERGFVTAIRHLAKASVLAEARIHRHRPDAIFVNSESGEYFQACCPDEQVVRKADFENQRRFIALDLLYAHPVRDDIRDYLLEHGMPREEYDWFINRQASRHAVLGVDYYLWNEKLIDTNTNAVALGELFGWYVITKQYWDRYQRPLMHTETNVQDAKEAPAWLWRQWHNVQMMRNSGIPVVGFTWYSLQDQVDWDIGLSAARGNINPVGLFDLNREPRQAAQAYRHLLQLFSGERIWAGAMRGELEELLLSSGAPG